MNRLLLLFLFIFSSLLLSAQDFNVDFKVDTLSGCSPLTVRFTDISTGTYPVVSRYWTFGDGTTSTDVSPVHTYSQPGRYKVDLGAQNSQGEWRSSETIPDQESHAIKIYPVLNPRYHQYQLCSDSIQLRSNAYPIPANMQTYLWSTGQTTPDIKVKSLGQYSVSVTGCGKTITDNIDVTSGTIYLAPSWIGNWNEDTFYVAMDLKTPYPSNAYSAVNWTWGDQTADNSDYSIHRYSIPGTYPVTATIKLNSDISASCGDTMATYNVTVRERYVQHNSWNNRDTSFYQGNVFRIFDTRNTGATHFWYGNNNSSADNGMAITSPGTYYVGISKNGDYITDTIRVTEDTTSLHARISVDSKNCNSVNFTDSSFSNITGITYAEWSFGDGSLDSSRAYELTHTYAKDSTYTVRLIVKNAIGMRDTAYQIITINATPQVDLMKDTTIAKGTGILLKNLLPVTANYSYKWSTGATTPSINVTTQNGYKLSATLCGTTVSDSVYIRVVDTPRVNFTYTKTPKACSPYHYTFTDVTPASASPLDSIVSYSWDLGDHTTADTKIASADYNPAQNYFVKLKVKTLSGLTATVTKQLYISHEWFIFAYISGEGRGPSCVDSTFADSYVTVPANAKYTIAWSNGSSKTTTAFSRSGQYFVYLKDSCGNIHAGDTIDIEMNDPLTVSVRQVKDTLYGSLSQYTATPAPTYTWRWYRNDTILNGQTSPFIIPLISGTYKAMVNSSLGCSVVSVPLNYTAPVQTEPKVVRYTYEVSPCNPQVYSFKGSISGIDSIADYQWIIGSQKWHTMDLTFEFTAGTHVVSFSVTDKNGDTTNWTRQIVVQAALPWTATIVNEAPACGDTAILTANSSPAAAGYLWSTGETLRTIHVTKSGRYYLQVKDSCDNFRATDSIDVLIYPQSAATIRLATGNNADTLVASAGVYYHWYKDNIALDEHQQILFPTASGSYTVSIVHSNGCVTTTAPFSYTLAVPGTTATDIVTPTDSTLRVTASFKHNFNPDNIFTAELMLDNGGGRTTGLQSMEIIPLGTVNSSNGNIIMNVSIPDSLACASSYVIRITASSPADTTIWSKQFSIVNQPAQPVITQRGDSLFTSGIYNWQWYRNNVAIDGATNANYRARANASYTVEARNGEGCNVKSSAVAVVITAVGEVTLGGNTAKVFPNPSEGQVYLQFSKPLLKAVTVKVHDLKGQVHYSRTTQQQMQQLDLGNLPKGLYMIELSGYGSKKVLNIILQ